MENTHQHYQTYKRKFDQVVPAPPTAPPSSKILRRFVNSKPPMCSFYIQNNCSKMGDPMHLMRFSHTSESSNEYNNSTDHHATSGPVVNHNHNYNYNDNSSRPPQMFDYFLVLDLEGRVEILEFPVLLVDAKILNVVDVFHRFVRPKKMALTWVNDYIRNKYAKFGLERAWHETAINFEEVIAHFEVWLYKHKLWAKERDGVLNRAAFVTCGNWDLNTKIPQQCRVSNMILPMYFTEWINLKDVYLNFYNRVAKGMNPMMFQLQIPILGNHHVGIDDAKNIVRVLQRMVRDGSVLPITGRRARGSKYAWFFYQNRI